MVMLLNSAGNTTTTTLIGSTVWLLDRHPEQRALFLADIPGRVATLVEEALRFDGPIHGLHRRTTEDVTLAGKEIPAGQQVFACYAAANHDPAVYDAPDEFQVDRNWKKLPAHMAFGYGIHHCIGANLARLEAEVALSTLYRRLPGLRIRPDFEPQQVPGLIFRGWMGLELTYDPPALPRDDR
jgi:cytochrome P450